MKAYKGFNADMTCRGFQYKEGETYHEDIADLCHKGFHACEYPLDVLAYYPPNSSVYHEVELEEVSDEHADDSKVCAKTIRVGARMDIASLVKASVEYTRFKCDESCSKHTTGDRDAASATGDRGAASAAGRRCAASATGDLGAASADNPTAIAVAWGLQGRAKGVIGAHIVCAEWRDGNLVDAKMAVVDGDKIKADTYYMLKNGEFTEVNV